jgi:hypothetical protein
VQFEPPSVPLAPPAQFSLVIAGAEIPIAEATLTVVPATVPETVLPPPVELPPHAASPTNDAAAEKVIRRREGFIPQP